MNSNVNTHKPRVLIIGGGFAGIRCALDLHKKCRNQVRIALVSKEEYFEYYPAMYRVVTGSSPMHAQISLSDIFEKTNVKVVQDEIVKVDIAGRAAQGLSGDVYEADYIILAIGSQNNYFNIEGVDEVSYNFKSIKQALRLKSHIHDLFKRHRGSTTDEMLIALHFIIVGGGPSGVELAGEMASYTKKIAEFHNVSESLITIDLVERNDRVLARLPKSISRKAEDRLRELGVNVLLNRSLVKSEAWTAYLGDMKVGARTVVWTAGVKPHVASQDIVGLEYSKRGRIVVDSYLQAKGQTNIFIAGDIADTPNAGLAQSALRHGQHIARVISADMNGAVRPFFVPQEGAYDIPIGPGWAILVWKNMHVFGRIGWWMRHVIDFKFYCSILSVRKAWKAFWSGRVNIEQDSVSFHTEPENDEVLVDKPSVHNDK